MNPEEAEKLARNFLSKSIQVDYCELPTQNIYGFNPEEEYLFTFQLYDKLSIGSSPYIGVSRKTGVVRYLGSSGE